MSMIRKAAFYFGIAKYHPRRFGADWSIYNQQPQKHDLS
jgi:hypothetical protein